jgi:hypothetical protein
MRKKLTAVTALMAMLAIPVSSFAQTMDLSVQPIQCATPNVHPRVSASVPATAVSGQVFFKADGSTNEYYVDMRKAADGTMWAYLPAPLPSTKSFTYRVVTLDNAGRRSSSPMMTIATAGTCPTVGVADAEKAAAAAVVVGLTSGSQQIVPTGFECKDLTNYITVSGEMKPNDECRRQEAAAPATTAAENAGLKKDTALALLLIGIGGAGVAIYQHNNKSNEPVSPSRP